MRRTRAKNQTLACDPFDSPEQHQAFVALPFRAGGIESLGSLSLNNPIGPISPVSNDDERRTAQLEHVVCAGNGGREADDRRRLHDVERLAHRKLSRLIDEPNGCRDIRPRERKRNRATQFAGADDSDIKHSCAIVVGLTNQVAIVTGGSRGIGLAVARALVAQGVSVMITGRDEGHLAAVRSRIEGAGPGRVETLRADVRSYEDMAHVVDATVSRFGGIDILVNNAGVGLFANVADMTPAQWSEVVDTNLTGVFNACHAAIPRFRERGGGFIINISSLAGTNAFVGGAAYCASKSGLNAFSEALMQEVRYDNIRVSYVMPGSVATRFAGNDESRGADWKIAPEDVADVVVNLLRHNPRSLPSRVEIRPSKPKK